MRSVLALACVGALGCDSSNATTDEQRSPYADESYGEIRSLTVEEVAELQAGKGMGLARAAELNSYPGPRHVLDLRAELSLDGPSIDALETIFARMQSQAQALGAAILREESELDRAFREERIDATALTQRTETLGRLLGQLRAVHLAAHLETKALLSPAQVATYDTLRGYRDEGPREAAEADQHEHPTGTEPKQRPAHAPGLAGDDCPLHQRGS